MVVAMKFVLFFCALLSFSLAFPQKSRTAEECNNSVCKLPECRCSSNAVPGGLTSKTAPQLVLITFDDAVTSISMEYYRKALYGRKNPNGCPISGTFFMSHEYTEYSLVNELYSNNQEIAMHSITHQTPTTYWQNASLETLNEEFGDMKLLVNKFGNIPTEDIKGLRMPYLQMAGNNQFQMMVDSDFDYDLSWVSENKNNLYWPYTTDYLSKQGCSVGPCPTESFPGKWVIPMIDWIDENGIACSMVDACVNIPTTDVEIFSWMKKQFHRHYDGNRAPFGFYAHVAWFIGNEIRFKGFLMFVEYLNSLPDVFMVSGSQVIDWMKNPLSAADMLKPSNIECRKVQNTTCVEKTCELLKEGKETRWLSSCVSSCPRSYPWLGNHLGNHKY